MDSQLKITHVIFDIDGLLLDTERLYTEATQTVCDEFGKTYTWDIKKQIMGSTEMESATKLVELMELPLSIEEYLSRVHKEHDRLFPTVPLLPGADRLVRHLYKHKVPLAVVTGSNERSFKLKCVKHKEFFELFDHLVISGSDPEVKRGKPAPDGFILAADRFPDKPDHSKVLAFEDAPNGVEAAHAAGMPCVWVPHKEQDRSALHEKTELVLDSLEDFKPEMFGLPAYDT